MSSTQKLEECELEIKFFFGQHKNLYALSSTKKQNINLIIKSIKKILSEHNDYFMQISNEILFLSDNKRKTYNYSNLKEKKISYMIKERLKNKNFTNNNGIAYKVSYSLETKTPNMVGFIPKYIKFKVRLRIIFKNSLIFKDWVLDITLVKYIVLLNNEINVTEINNNKKKLFYFDDKKNFINNNFWNNFDNIELELEYSGKTQKILEIKDSLIQDIANKFINYFIIKQNNIIFIQNKIIKKLGFLLKKPSRSFRSIINKAIELTSKSYLENVLPFIANFAVTEKLDGERCFLYYNDEEKYIIFNKKILKFDIELSVNSVILDCEYYNKKLYAFDILELNGISIANDPFGKRYKLLSEKFMNNKKINIKVFIKLNEQNYCKILQNTYKVAKMKIDGLILTSLDNNYNYTKNYKWKPVEHMTIDFLVKECHSLLVGLNPYKIKNKNNKLYLLFSAINKISFMRLMNKHVKYYNKIFLLTNKNYFPTLFTPPDNVNIHIFESSMTDLDNKICEFNYNIKLNQWNLIKIRDDQSPNIKDGIDIGNNYFTALDIWNNYKNPLDFKKICTPRIELEKQFYFVKDNTYFKQTRNYNRYVISKILDNTDNVSNVLDLGVGRGADIFRFNKRHTKKLLGLDLDINALEELISRYRNAIKNKKIKFYSMILRIKQLNVNNNYQENIKKLIMSGLINENEKFNLIFSNFAFHYFLGNYESIINVISFIKYFSKKGTEIIFSCFDGIKIFDKFKNIKNDKYTILEGNTIKIEIIKKFNSNKRLQYGQIISVTHPFSSGSTYDEPLVNLKYIKKIFKENGFKHIYTKNFLDFYEDYNNKNLMTDSDKEYCSLYVVNKFKKK